MSRRRRARRALLVLALAAGAPALAVAPAAAHMQVRPAQAAPGEPVQTYRDGEVVRWIGSAGSDFPASITTISTSVPRENAGGEGGAGAAPAPGPPPADATGPDWLARGLALAALLAVASAALAHGRRPRAAGAIAAWRWPRT
jgi:hypothetical protein